MKRRREEEEVGNERVDRCEHSSLGNQGVLLRTVRLVLTEVRGRKGEMLMPQSVSL